MTKKQRIDDLLATATRMEQSVSSTAGPSSEEWVSPERRREYLRLASDKRKEAARLRSAR